MPFYRHLKTRDPFTPNHEENYPNPGPVDVQYPTRAAAFDDLDPKLETVSFVPNYAERANWTSRERERFCTGTYFHVPWANCFESKEDHFAHLSLSHKGLIAYTKNDEAGIADRQTRVRPGKYLQEYYADTFTSADIARYVAECGASHLELHLATTPDDIETVYINGPSSCMGNKTFRTLMHPVRAYGDSDLAVAYYGSLERPSARAVVWPDKHIYSRVYGGNGVLERLLDAGGYVSGSLIGARIRAIPQGDKSWLMPYIDSVDSASLVAPLDGAWIVLDDEGKLNCKVQDGMTTNIATFTCDNCDEELTENCYHSDGICQDCYDNSHQSCSDCREDYSNDDLRSLTNGDALCSTCYDDAEQTCAVEDCDTTWIERDLPRRVRVPRTNDSTVQHLCIGCAETYVYCTDHKRAYLGAEAIAANDQQCACSEPAALPTLPFVTDTLADCPF